MAASIIRALGRSPLVGRPCEIDRGRDRRNVRESGDCDRIGCHALDLEG
jgi:hypothetical protein